MTTDIQKLIFVYNANSGLRNLLIDGAHKIVSPGTYECKLCDITYGALTEKKAWKSFRENAPIAMEFLHKDEFKKQYASKFGHSFDFPVVLAVNHDALQLFISASEFDTLKEPSDLITLIQSRI